jgi:L-amino acid N-acyltransferase YncA
MTDELEAIRADLEAIAERLADAAIERLRAALEEEGRDTAAAEERRLTRARRAVEKAVHELGDDG